MTCVTSRGANSEARRNMPLKRGKSAPHGPFHLFHSGGTKVYLAVNSEWGEEHHLVPRIAYSSPDFNGLIDWDSESDAEAGLHDIVRGERAVYVYVGNGEWMSVHKFLALMSTEDGREQLGY